jgi:predicted patatin/cPLA2 family phospholipase
MTHEVIAILRDRAARGSTRPHGDDASVALAVEGGSMRGVVSAGMVTALERLGLVNAFDAVYGASAGAINAAYFLAGQAALGTTIYSENINGPSFISFLRPLRGRPIIDLDFLLDVVVPTRKPLDIARVMAATAPLAVLATDVERAEPAVLRDFRDEADLCGALRAGATMPILAGGPFAYRGRTYFDASLTAPIPVAAAEADGHSHVLVLLTRPRLAHWSASAFDRLIIAPRLRRLSPPLAERYLDRGRPYARLVSQIAAGTGPLGRASVLGITPAPPAIGKLERNRDVLLAGAERGLQAVLAAFGGQSS